MSTKNHKFTLTTLLTVLALLILAGARVINASAAQLNQSDERRASSEIASVADDRRSGEVEFVGVVQAIGDQIWTISGQSVVVRPGVEIKSMPTVGDQVKVHAFLAADGSLVAREIGPAFAAMGSNSNANSADDNGNTNDDNSSINDDNGNANGNDNGNVNDDNGNANDDNNGNANDDNGNANDDDNGNEDHGNDNGNGNGNMNDNGNDNHGQGG